MIHIRLNPNFNWGNLYSHYYNELCDEIHYE